MKIFRFLLLMILVLFLVDTAWGSGVTLTPTRKGLRGEYVVYSFAWNAGDVDTPESAVSEIITGEIVGIKFEPVSGGTPYPPGTDIVLLDTQGNDILQGLGVDLNPAAGVTNYRTPDTTDGHKIFLVGETVGLVITGGISGTSPEGVVEVIGKR